MRDYHSLSPRRFLGFRALEQCLLLAMILSAPLARAQFEGAPPAPRADEWKAALAQSNLADAANQQYKNNPDYLVRPGLLANRKDHSVRLWARSTRLTPADPVEFLLIPENSGKDYESVAVLFCKASDVKAALEFVGLKPGRPVDFDANIFWPKGERVIAEFDWLDPGPPGGEAQRQHVRAEDLLVDTTTGRPLEKTGYVFTGSYSFKTDEGAERFAADVMDSASIISDYNEQCALMDVPRQAPQSAVYGTLKLNPAYRFTPGDSVEIVLKPERPDGPARVHDYFLSVSIPRGDLPATMQKGTFVLSEAGKPAKAQPTLVGLLGEFGRLTESGIDPYVTVGFDDSMTLLAAEQAAKFLATIDVEKGVRIEPPLPGRLYYRNYTPRPEWRDRSKRLGRPWELRLTLKGGQVAGALILPADGIDPATADAIYPVNTSAVVAKVLKEKSDKWAHSVYIFAPAEMTVGQLLAFIGPGMEIRPAMYVFVEK